LHKDRKSLTL